MMEGLPLPIHLHFHEDGLVMHGDTNTKAVSGFNGAKNLSVNRVNGSRQWMILENNRFCRWVWMTGMEFHGPKTLSENWSSVALSLSWQSNGSHPRFTWQSHAEPCRAMDRGDPHATGATVMRLWCDLCDWDRGRFSESQSIHLQTAPVLLVLWPAWVILWVLPEDEARWSLSRKLWWN